MTHVITSLCVRDGGCIVACPVACIVPGLPQDEWPIYYIDPVTCIDCGACIPACPVGAIFTKYEVPLSYIAMGGEILNGEHKNPEFTEKFDGFDFEGNSIHLPNTRKLQKGEIIDLRSSIEENKAFFESGPGYFSLKK